MKCIILSLLLTHLMLVPVIAQAALQVYPSDPVPGSVLLLIVDGVQNEVVMDPFFDQEITFYQGNSVSVALLAIPLDVERGNYSLLAWEESVDGGYINHRGGFEIQVKDRAVDRLTLPRKMVQPKDKELLKRIESEYLQLRGIFLSVTEPVSWGCFSLPVSDKIGSLFGVRRILNGIEKSPHSGTDFRSPRGRQIKVASSGVVTLASPLHYTGNTVVVDHGGGLVTLYAHLQDFSVSEGDSIVCGDSVGTVGSTGRSTGPHLHWGMKFQGVPVDPLSLIDIASKLKIFFSKNDEIEP